jgi:hypothetical protein
MTEYIDGVIAVILTHPKRYHTGSPAKLERSLRAQGIRVDVYADKDSEGAACATRKALQLMADVHRGQHVLFCEDDITVCDGLGKAVVDAALDWKAGFLTHEAVRCFCDMRELPEGSAPGLYTRSPLGCDGFGWWGNQCMLIHRDIVKYLSGEDWFSPWVCAQRGVYAHTVKYRDEGRQCSDIRMSYLIARNSQRNQYVVHVPSLAIHVGTESICFDGRGLGERETRNKGPHRRTNVHRQTISPAEFAQGGPPEVKPSEARETAKALAAEPCACVNCVPIDDACRWCERKPKTECNR